MQSPESSKDPTAPESAPPPDEREKYLHDVLRLERSEGMTILPIHHDRLPISFYKTLEKRGLKAYNNAISMDEPGAPINYLENFWASGWDLLAFSGLRPMPGDEECTDAFLSYVFVDEKGECLELAYDERETRFEDLKTMEEKVGQAYCIYGDFM